MTEVARIKAVRLTGCAYRFLVIPACLQQAGAGRNPVVETIHSRLSGNAHFFEALINPGRIYQSFLKQFSDNPSFKKWLGDTNFGATYREQGGQVAAGARYGR